jgi:23S rRNA-/tRNA-specific pseudouridylate synthase
MEFSASAHTRLARDVAVRVRKACTFADAVNELKHMTSTLAGDISALNKQSVREVLRFRGDWVEASRLAWTIWDGAAKASRRCHEVCPMPSQVLSTAQRQSALAAGLLARLHSRRHDWQSALTLQVLPLLPLLPHDVKAVYDNCLRGRLDRRDWGAALAIACAGDLPMTARANKELAAGMPHQSLWQSAILLRTKDSLLPCAETFATAVAERLGWSAAVRMLKQGFRVDVTATGHEYWQDLERLPWGAKLKRAAELGAEGHLALGSLIDRAASALSHDLTVPLLAARANTPHRFHGWSNDIVVAAQRLDVLIGRLRDGSAKLIEVLDLAVSVIWTERWNHWLRQNPLTFEVFTLVDDRAALAELAINSAFWSRLIDANCVSYEQIEPNTTAIRVDFTLACETAIIVSEAAQGSSASRLCVVYDAPGVVVLSKPAGMATITDPLTEGRDGPSAVRHFSDARTVHRLDADTSGSLTIATNDQAERVLKAVFRRGTANTTHEGHRTPAIDGPKSYLCLCGRITREKSPDKGVIRAKLNDQTSMSRYCVLESFGDVVLVRVHISTGRYHQVRRHLASIGLPVLNDGRYGGGLTFTPLLRRIAIHAEESVLQRPSDGVGVVVSSAMPDDFALAVRRLRRQTKKT